MMADTEDPKTPKEALVKVINKKYTDELWKVNYFPVIPISFGPFDLGSTIPALFYLFRRGVRRGTGQFRKIYGAEDGLVSVSGLGKKLVADGVVLSSEFHSYVLIADYLLCNVFVNKLHSVEREADVVRMSACHYLSAWIDLQNRSVHTRLVPELLMNTLLQQLDGEYVQRRTDSMSSFAVTGRYSDHALLRPFSVGMSSAPDDLHEEWSESATVDIDQLLCIRIAQKLKHAPTAVNDHVKGAISNQWPVAVSSMRVAGDDIAAFLRAYADGVPRKALLSMLESGFGLGLSCMFLDSMQRLQIWMHDGRLPPRDEHAPCALFIDGSNGSDRALRAVAEDSADLRLRGVRQFSLALAQLRILDQHAHKQSLHQGISFDPDPTGWINLLGDLKFNRHEQGAAVNQSIESICCDLSGQLQKILSSRYIAEFLIDVSRSPVARFGGALIWMMGDKNTNDQLYKFLAGVWRTDEPDGMVRSRRRRDGNSRRVVRSFVLSDVLLDFLVHRHLVADDGARRHLSLREFLRILRERYGLYVDRAPAGQAISADLLARNRRLIEERLRDLGLLVSVNDADGMKFLRPRFSAARSGGAS
jgi:hypothetical protein